MSGVLYTTMTILAIVAIVLGARRLERRFPPHPIPGWQPTPNPSHRPWSLLRSVATAYVSFYAVIALIGVVFSVFALLAAVLSSVLPPSYPSAPRDCDYRHPDSCRAP